MPITEIALKILDLKRYGGPTKKERLCEIAEEISKKKKEIFTRMNLTPQSFNGVRVNT